VRKVAVPLTVAGAWLMASVWLVGTYALSWLCYHVYESRITRLRDVDVARILRRVTRPSYRPVASVTGD
jgi:hypothetical protein